MGWTSFTSSPRYSSPHPVHPPCTSEIPRRLPRGRYYRVLDRCRVLVECASSRQGGCAGLGNVELEFELDRSYGVERRIFGEASRALGDGVDDRSVWGHGGGLGWVQERNHESK
jgi:hypothetical protein